jgi:bifunctional pyridoxal-dependent enzyme with beta-cystathionase and maltose regulon repressor activities
MDKEQIAKILADHAEWLKDNTKGKRADLQWADLQGAYLQWADLHGAYLQGAYLQGAQLDFSCLPLKCSSFGIVADDRLVLQLFAHIARLNVEHCSKDVKRLVEKLPELAKNGFCKYREDVAKI